MPPISSVDVTQLDSNLAFQRILNNLQNDFIYAPHISIIYHFAADELWGRLKEKLKNGTFDPGLPITMEIPKPSGFCRPGSILLPYDRLTYQLLVDNLAPVANRTLDTTKVFSNALLEDDPDGFMFEPASDCYTRYNEANQLHCQNKDFTHVLTADIAGYFEHLNQHILINSLLSDGCDTTITNALEKLLSTFAQKNSFGIIQGMIPSDFLGNYYLCVIDADHELHSIPFTRYVDDISIFFSSEDAARRHLVHLGTLLRKQGLSFNEAKTKIVSIPDFIHDETLVERLFEAAKEELQPNFERVDFYQSTTMWDFMADDEIEVELEKIELEATKKLFDTEAKPKTRSKIDRFCLPIFIAAGDDYAVNYVLEQYVTAPHMAQIYAKYLKDMLVRGKVDSSAIERLLENRSVIFEFQLMWLFVVLMSSKKASMNNATLMLALRTLQDANKNQALRAVCAIFVGKWGTAAHRRMLRACYGSETSAYMQGAILYAARYFPPTERDTCYRGWGGHTELNALIVTASRASF